MKTLKELLGWWPVILLVATVGCVIFMFVGDLNKEANMTVEEREHREIWKGKVCKNGVLYYRISRGAAPAYDKHTKEVVLCENAANY